MNAPKHIDTHWTELQRRAETLVGLPSSTIEFQMGREITRLIREIRANHTALEKQNEELSKSRDALDIASRKHEALYAKFANLFNFAPIGYLVIDRNGVIQDINLAAALSLNAPRSRLTGRCITDFIHRDDQDCFYYQKLACQKGPESSMFELKMKSADGFLFDAQVQMQSFGEAHSDEQRYTVSIVDISEHVQLSASFVLQQYCLELACRATTMQELLAGYVERVKSYLQCDAVGIRLRDDAGYIPYQAYEGFSRAFFESESPLCLHTDQCMCTAVVKGAIDLSLPFYTKRGSFYINSASRHAASMSPRDLGMTRNACQANGYESVALIPVTIGDTVEGLIHVADRREHRFSLRLVENLEDVASRLGLAVQRFHLQERLHESVEALNVLSRHLLTVQEDEQRRIAMELHDGCGQDLNVLKLRLKNLQRRLPADAADLKKECDGLLAYSDKIIDDIRNIAHGLKPAALEALGLTAATRQMIREYSIQAKVQVETDIDLLDRIENPMTRVCLFRIFQEALTNVHKHAQATWVLVAASLEGGIIRIRIEDNGIGFDTQTHFHHANGRMGMGLSAVVLRCRMIGAEFTIDSEAGKGTRLAIRVPCPNPKAMQ